MHPVMMQIIASCTVLIIIPTYYAFANYNKIPMKIHLGSVALIVAATFISVVGTTCLYMAVKNNNQTGAIVMLSGCYPVITIILSVFFLKENFTFQKVLGVFTILVGAFLLNRK
jgi:uncharacterized membrane protein